MREINSFLLLFLMIFTSFACSKQEQVQVKQMDLVQGVYASGNVMPVGHYEITGNVTGIIDRILVNVGQNVEVGTPLVKLQNQPNESNLRIAKNQLELARRNAEPDSDLMRQLSQQVENSLVAFKQDSVELRYQTSRNNYRIATSKLHETRDRLQIELDNARNNFLAQESMTGDYTILSAINGKVYNIIPKEGELIAGNRPIMEIGAADRFETELQVDETDIVLVREGQLVYYQLDAIEGAVLSGVISMIYPRINTIERTAKVIASIDPLGYPMYPGMALEANIVVNEKENVLVLPVTFITAENEVILGDKSRKQIVTGIRDLNYVEVVSGLREGDIILKPEP
jgi:HlyD family secretion protein